MTSIKSMKSMNSMRFMKSMGFITSIEIYKNLWNLNFPWKTINLKFPKSLLWTKSIAEMQHSVDQWLCLYCLACKRRKDKTSFPNAKRPMLTTFSPKTEETDGMMDRPPQNQTNTPAKRTNQVQRKSKLRKEGSVLKIISHNKNCECRTFPLLRFGFIWFLPLSK